MGDEEQEDAALAKAPMEFGSLPLDPVYAWSLVLEPVETLIERTQELIDRLARETVERGREFDGAELEQRFLAYYEHLVREGVLTRMPDADPTMGARVLGPRRWLRAQRLRIRRLASYYREHGLPGAPPHPQE